MKLLIIRHGDPDYTIDSLTPTGRKEAELLARRLEKLDIAAFYVSPLGRARDTAAPTLRRLGREATVCDWLREFGPAIHKPYDEPERLSCPWDWRPETWTDNEKAYTIDGWWDNLAFEAAGIKASYDRVTGEFDRLLARHGYERQGHMYHAAHPNSDTLALFCHFGVECVLLSHLLNLSPMALWHGFCVAPSSVTTVVTEERTPGNAYFRLGAFGDTSHLYAAGQAPAFAARFCETYDTWTQRH